VTVANNQLKHRSILHGDKTLERRKVGGLIKGIKDLFRNLGKAIKGAFKKPPKGLDQNSVRIAKGKGPKSVQEQKSAAKKLEENKNFRRCLEGKKAAKYCPRMMFVLFLSWPIYICYYQRPSLVLIIFTIYAHKVKYEPLELLKTAHILLLKIISMPHL
jgi:hypothetical protein